ncbi:aspartate ammonia-lyase [Anaerocolumna xylanovorans]|uniref:Aspartate ammonia-lyase n=1 Tax=Anaerocolumna xylanovorans DSM 12503 TaxID=1121345 RepID=A0A1M7YB31_9FIRM|nr:aspartate ammonia-lyase [Anaerocolumna xylanovorans]SHO49827.1 aspartate ammonia-lyase [Anaerocolumna xylanovorans DSM 12503]
MEDAYNTPFKKEIFYGEETKKALANFALNYKETNLKLIYAIVKVKKAAAKTYSKLGVGKEGIYETVVKACDRILGGAYKEQFIVDALQGGAGTSANMNVNEVLAGLSEKIWMEEGKEKIVIHPLDDINRGQSTNDVYPTALRIASIDLIRELSDGCAKLQQALQLKEREYEGIKKLGRTELMDAIPITLGEEFGAYAQAIARDRWRIYKVEERLRQVNLGGTAVGNASNADRKYRFMVIEELREITGMGLAAAEYPMDITQNNDVFVEVSGLLKALAVNLMKISGDLRLMNSGPFGGIGEIHLKPLQAGSTIMPGKVNPVIPEMVTQAAMKVMANDYAITMAASRGEFELNAFLPLIADSLLESLMLLQRAVELFRSKCIEVMEPDKERCEALLEGSYAFATAYTKILGYDKVRDIIAQHRGNPQAVKKALEEEINK